MHIGNPVKKVKKKVGSAMKSVGLGGVYNTFTKPALNTYNKIYKTFTQPAIGVYKGVYNTTTGHYQRQQNRLAREEQERQERIERQQREYAYNQRKEQIDELRERIGAGGTRFRTNRQDKRAASSLWASGSNAETLG